MFKKTMQLSILLLVICSCGKKVDTKKVQTEQKPGVVTVTETVKTIGTDTKGRGEPVQEAGEEGDRYVDLDTRKLYTFKNGEWVFSMQLPKDESETTQQEDFQVVYVQHPDDITEPQPGIYYIVRSTRKGYKLESGKLVLKNSGIIAQVAQTGKKVIEARGPAPKDVGSDGDVYIDITTGDYYHKKDGNWSRLCLSERAGYICGQAVPTAEIGINDDIYLRDNRETYKKVDGKWVLLDHTSIERIVKPSNGKAVIIKSHFITAEGKDDTNSNFQEYILPYLTQNDENSAQIENLINKDTNAEAATVKTNKNAQVIFQFNLAKIRDALSLKGKVLKAEINLKVVRSYLDDRGTSEIFCLLNIGKCSGKSFGSNSRYSKLLNPDFFTHGQDVLVNELFTSIVNDTSIGFIENESEGKLKTFHLNKTIALDKLFEIDNNSIRDIINTDGILTFVLADDMSLERLPVLKLQVEEKFETEN